MCWVLFAVCSGCNQMESWAQGQFCHLAKCALHSPGGERQRQRGRGKAAKDHQGCLHNSFSGSKISPTNCTLFFIGPKSNHCLVNLSKLINGFLCCFMNCVTRAPLLYFVRRWVALSLVSEWVSQSGMRDTLPNLHFLQYIKAWMSSTDPVSSITNCYRLIVSYTDPVHSFIIS